MNAPSDIARALAAGSPTSLPASLFGLPDQAPHERVLLAADPQTGLKAILAVHSTARGPAFGGCRFWSYDSELAALNDALRLSQGMSLKNALAQLPFGGGKAVIIKPAGHFDRPALFAAFGRAVQSLAGAYITAEDVGTTTADMLGMQAHTQFVSGIPREGAFGGDPSPKTAYGVFVSIDEGVKRVLGRNSLEGVRVALQGLGAVGWHLAEYLHRAGAKLVVADVGNMPELAQFYLDEVIVPTHQLLGRAVERGVARGEFRSVDITAVVQSLMASAQFLIDSEASLKGVEARLNGAPKPTMDNTAPRHEGQGKVEALADEAITLSHGPIASLKWGSMTMDFKVPLKGGLPRHLEVGDPVSFEFYMDADGMPQLTRLSHLAPEPQPAPEMPHHTHGPAKQGSKP